MKKLFWLCFAIILFYKIFALLNMLPPVIPYGDIIYHITDFILSIINQFAIAISGAIAFYYIGLFFYTKNNVDVANNIRSEIVEVLCYHMEILENIDYFKELKKNRKITFKSKDLVHLFNIINNSLKVKDGYVYDKHYEDLCEYKIKYEYEKAIGEYFLQIDEDILVQIIDYFNSYDKKLNTYINDLRNNTSFLYYLKGALEGIKIFIKPDVFQYNGILKSVLKHKNIDANVITECKKCICLGYLKFLADTINCYNIFDDYINSITENKLIKFIKMIN